MHVWTHVNNGPIQLTAGPLEPHVFEARLRLQGANARNIPGAEQQDGTFLFEIPDDAVQDILTGDGSLMLTTRHAITPGVAEQRWGWRYRIRHGGQNLTLTENNAQIGLEADGFYHSALANAPDHIGRSRQDIIVR